MDRGTSHLVAVDLDDVLFDFVGPFFSWHNLRYGTDLTPQDLGPAKYLFEAWDGTKEEAIDRLPRFFDEVDVLGLEPITGAAECLERIGAEYRLAVVSARDPSFVALTETWIDRYFTGVFDRVILGIGHSERGERSVTKADVCRQIGASVLIDDQLGHLTPAAEKGVRGLLFGRYPWNRRQPMPPNTIRVADWPEVCTALG